MKRLMIVLVDLLIIYGSFLLSFNLLEKGLMDYKGNIFAFQIVSPLICAFYLIFMYAFGLYNSTRRSWGDVAYTVLLVSASLTIAVMAACFFIRGAAMAFPRSIVFLSALFYWILLTIWRMFIWKMERRSHGVKNVLVIGSTPAAESIARLIREKHNTIYNIKWVFNETDEQLPAIIKKCDEIFLSSGVIPSEREKILLLAGEVGTGIYFVPEYLDIPIMSSSMQKTGDIPTFHIEGIGLTLEERFVKRSVDLILGGIGFLLALPIGLIAAFFVKLDGGPVFYCQERLTRDGKVFEVFKFRSMVPNAEKLSGPVLAGENDPRITKTGKLMRATRVDELPQILNILKGDMSIVGPRPERPFFTEQFAKKTPHYTQRLKVKAGLTGLAQVEGKYNTSFENKLRYDLLYISNYSLFQDFLIILQTIKILFLKESTEGITEEVETVKKNKEVVFHT